MKHRTGFSLVELLTVLAIISILAALAVPAFNSIVGGSNLNRSGQLIGDQMIFARQEAATKNREVRVLFYSLPNGSISSWRGVQVFRVDQTPAGAETTPLTRLLTLPENVMINSNATLSPLLEADSTLQGTTNLPSYGNVSFAGFRYLATGLPDSTITDANGFVTITPGHSSGSTPENYYTLQINPLTGKVTIFRP